MEFFSFFHPLLLLFLMQGDTIRGQQILKVPEGIGSYPKLLTTFPIYEATTTQCSIDSVEFKPPNGQRTSLIPKLFGIVLQQYPIVTSTTASDDTTTRHVVTTPNMRNLTTSGMAQTTSDVVTTSYDTTTIDDVTTTTQNKLQMKSSKKIIKRESPDNYSGSGSIINRETHVLNATAKHQTTVGILLNNLHTTRTTPVTTPIYDYDVITDATSVEGKLVQLYDLDREKSASHVITVHCSDENGTETEFPLWFIIEVTDVNDNTPVFVSSSLYTQVSPNITFGDVVMLPQATDADVGLNALLNYNYVTGTQRIRYKNGTNINERFPVILIWKTGQVVLSAYKLRDNTEITFKIAVKDLGDRHDGNRATATATIVVCSDCDQMPPSKPHAISVWIIVVPSVLFVMALSITILVISKLRGKRRLERCVLVIDDETLLGNASEL